MANNDRQRGPINIIIDKILSVIKVSLYNSSGTEIGNSATSPVYVSAVGGGGGTPTADVNLNDGAGNNITSTTGYLDTVVKSSALPSGAATAALQTTGNGILTTIDADTGNIATSTGTIKTNTDPLVTAGGGGYVRQDSTATIAKESGGNLASVKTNTDKLDVNLSTVATAANQTNGTQKTQQVDGSGNVQPAGTTQPLGVNVIIGDGTNKIDAVAVADSTTGKRGIVFLVANSTGSARLMRCESDFIADGKSTNTQMLMCASVLAGYNGSTLDKLKSVNTGQLVVTQKDSSGNEAAIMDAPARRGYNQQSDQYGNIAECTTMGDLRSVTPVRLVGSQFDGTTVDSNFWTATVSTIGAGDGTVTQASAQAVLTSGTANAAFATLNSVRRARYVGGVGIRYRGVIQLGDTGTANNTRKWGVAWGATMPTITDGAYFQVSGTTFSIVTLKNGTPTAVNSGSFNGTVAAYTLTTNAATYEIYWTNSKVQFVINDVLIHTVTASSTTWADTMGHHVYMDNRNSGILGAGVTLSCRTATIYRLGEIITQPMYYYFAAGTTAGVNLKLGAGNVHQVIINNALNNAVITLSDSTSAATPAMFVHTAGATYTGPVSLDLGGAPFYNGLRLTVSGANASVTVVYE